MTILSVRGADTSTILVSNVIRPTPNLSKLSEGKAIVLIDLDIQFYMKVPLSDGTYTNGRIDYNRHPDILGIPDLDLTGRRALDIAANDGFWSFWCERRGAAEVLAIDVDGFDGYDWGYDGPPPEARPQIEDNHYSQWTEAGAGFWALHSHFRSNVVRQQLSIYDLDPKVHGKFDLIFNYGLIYHLRHPLLSLDRTRAVCRGALVLETHIVNSMSCLPASLFYHDNVFRGWTNWTGPTEAAIAAWLRSAGFPVVKTVRPDQRRPNGRQIFVACVDHNSASEFSGELVDLDDAYFETVATTTTRFVEQGDVPPGVSS